MKVGGDWIEQPATQAVCTMLTDAGHQALFVGGCVRNALLGAPVSDIDISTDARPEVVQELAEKAGFKAVPTGVEHGTITVVARHIPHEVTTFRRDVATDGRRATVSFSTDVTEDARRRDFTMNALYASPDGTVIDPLGGLDDLVARRVRFIDDAGQRIREDYLRSLRFFRFHAWYGDQSAGLDTEGLAAIADHVDGLDSLSRERVGSEVIKLLSAPEPATSVAAMRAAGVLPRVLPGADDRYLGPLVHLEELLEAPVNPLRRLAALGGENRADQLRLSKSQSRQFDLLTSELSLGASTAELGYRHGFDRGLDIVLLRAALFEVPPDTNVKEDLRTGSQATFPIGAADLMPDYEGQALGKELSKRERDWIDSGFSLTRDDLLNK